MSSHVPRQLITFALRLGKHQHLPRDLNLDIRHHPDLQYHDQQQGHLVCAFGGHLVQESTKLVLLLILDTAVHNLCENYVMIQKKVQKEKTILNF